MPEEIKVLAARRIYEFRPDDLRLAVLSTQAMRSKIQSQFGFQQALLGAAVQIFGPIDVSGQGFTFATGSVAHSDGEVTPIRFLQIEPTRIVIDVAAPSKAIDPIFRTLVNVLGEAKVPDGSPAIGKPTQHLDYSELSARLAFPIEAILAPRVPSVLTDVVGRNTEIAAAIYVQSLAPGEAYPGFPPQDSAILRIAPRQGFPIKEQVYFSSAPVDSDRHVDYLTKLEAALHGSSSTPQAVPRRGSHKR